MSAVEYGLLALSSLLVIIDPLATVPAFLAMTSRLSALPGVTKVHHDQSRGVSPMQFNLTFVWDGGTAR